jgi:uncharacterized protein (DUF1697 family)
MTYVAFLRAINVGGNSIVSMAAIKEAIEGLGLKDVRTYINSGNVVFSSPASAAPKLAHSIEMAIERRTGLAVRVVVLSRAALKKVVDAIPAQWVDDKVMRCYVLLLWKDLDNGEILTLLPNNPVVEELKYVPGAVIWRVDRNDLGKSKLTRMIGTPIYKQLTMRSVNTIRKLNELMA